MDIWIYFMCIYIILCHMYITCHYMYIYLLNMFYMCIYIYIFYMYIYIYIYATSLKWYCSTCPLQFRFATTQTLTTSPKPNEPCVHLEVSRAKGAISRHLIRLINPVLFGVRLLVIAVSTGAALLNVDTPADHQHLRGYHQYDGTTLLNHHHLFFSKKTKGGGTEMLDPPEYISPEN